MKIKNQIILLVSLIFMLIISASIFQKFKKVERILNAKYSCGKILYIYKTTKGSTYNGFAFFYDNKRIKGVFGGDLDDCYKNRECIGKCYQVEFSSKNPENNVMLFDKPCNCDDIKDNIK